MKYLIAFIALVMLTTGCGGSSTVLRDGFNEVGETIMQGGDTLQDGLEEAEETAGQAGETIEDGIGEIVETVEDAI